MKNYVSYQQVHLSYGISGKRNQSQRFTLAILRLLVVSVILVCYFLLDRATSREFLLLIITAWLLSFVIVCFVAKNRSFSVWLSNKRYLELAFDEILIFIACYYSGGLHSPYILTLYLPLLVHAIAPLSFQLLAVTLVTMVNLFLLAVTGTPDWPLFVHLMTAILLGTAFINILVYNDLRIITAYAIHDGLTGLYSYRYFWDQLRGMMEPGSQIKTFSIIMIDLDDFKRLNDDHGHLEGDRVLREIADTIKANVRDSDLVARYGGDEFAIILPGMGYERCRSVVDRLSKSIVELGYFDHVSIGAALYPEEATTAEELVNLADTRMYRDKHRSKHPAYPDPPPVTS
ncbi:MAG: GGDEF domain-containing protein [Bacillota bacterium]|jgi:diguanylate cyclase (GGDEF)-like protein|nr:GGDEF domain-containing protein [Bacillota bacterium]